MARERSRFRLLARGPDVAIAVLRAAVPASARPLITTRIPKAMAHAISSSNAASSSKIRKPCRSALVAVTCGRRRGRRRRRVWRNGLLGDEVTARVQRVSGVSGLEPPAAVGRQSELTGLAVACAVAAQ